MDKSFELVPKILVVEELNHGLWAPVCCGVGYVTVQDEDEGLRLMERWNRLAGDSGKLRIRSYVPAIEQGSRGTNPKSGKPSSIGTP